MVENQKLRTKEPRKICEIAAEIKKSWAKVYFGAVPYLNAMMHLNTLDDRYILDPADEIVMYFLANASTWRGEDARRIKKELNDMLKNHNKSW